MQGRRSATARLGIPARALVAALLLHAAARPARGRLRSRRTWGATRYASGPRRSARRGERPIEALALPERLERLGYRRVHERPAEPGEYFWGRRIFWIYRRAHRWGGRDRPALLFGLLQREEDGTITGGSSGRRRAAGPGEDEGAVARARAARRVAARRPGGARAGPARRTAGARLAPGAGRRGRSLLRPRRPGRPRPGSRHAGQRQGRGGPAGRKHHHAAVDQEPRPVAQAQPGAQGLGGGPRPGPGGRLRQAGDPAGLSQPGLPGPRGGAGRSRAGQPRRASTSPRTPRS